MAGPTCLSHIPSPRPHALRPCARQPRGFHFSWNEALYCFARRRPQLTRGPAAANLLQMLSVQTSLLVLGCNRIHKAAFSAGHHMRTVPVFASLVVNPRRSIQCFASLVVNPRRSIAPAAQFRRRHNRTCQLSLRDLVVQHDGHHPCWKAAHFLPCTLPPDVLRLPRAQRGRIHYGPSHRRILWGTCPRSSADPARSRTDLYSG